MKIRAMHNLIRCSVELRVSGLWKWAGRVWEPCCGREACHWGFWQWFWGQRECSLTPAYCCSSSAPGLLTCWWNGSKRKKNWNPAFFSLFPAGHRPPSSAWRPVALTLLTLCLVLLIGLLALGLVCKSVLWFGGAKVCLGWEILVTDFFFYFNSGICGQFNVPYSKALIEMMRSERSTTI